MEGMISGALASSLSTLILYPWEKIKINMQTDESSSSIRLIVKKIQQKQGWNGFYKGLQPLIVGNSLSYAIYFFIYQKVKLIFPEKTIKSSIICSTIAGVICTFLVNPFWVLQTKSALASSNQNFFQTLQKTLQNQGLGSLWKGLNSSLLLVSNPIIQFCVYEFLKLKAPKNQKLVDLWIFLIAAFSKAIATLFTYPLTVLRTYQHLDQNKRGTLFLIVKIIQKQGLKALFKGFTPKLIQTVSNSAILLMIYERLSKIVFELIKTLFSKKVLKN